MALLLGLIFAAGIGIAHHYGLLAIQKLRPAADDRRTVAITGTFLGLLLLHTAEILLFALIYRLLIGWGALGSFVGSNTDDWTDLIYFSGINFATLGYTQIEAEGPIRMVSMMQSLAGFMLLTWSATFLYSVCEKSWRD